MERLTQKDVYGVWYVPLRTPGGVFITTEMIYERLAAYENTGLEPEEIAAPQVKLGETIYAILWSNGRPHACVCTVIGTRNNLGWDSPKIRIREQSQGREFVFHVYDFGKWLFETKEEAEAHITKEVGE